MSSLLPQQLRSSTNHIGTHHPIAVFAVLTLLLGWLPAGALTFLPVVPLVVLMTSAPILAVLILQVIRKDSLEYRALLRLPSGIQWYMALSMPILWAGLMSVLNLIFPGSGSYYQPLPMVGFTCILLYILFITEQVVWRDFVKTHLHYTPTITTLLTSGLFILIYLPMCLIALLVDIKAFTLGNGFFGAIVVQYVFIFHAPGTKPSPSGE